MNSEAVHHLKNIKKISEELMNELTVYQPLGKGVGKRDHIIWELNQVHEKAKNLLKYNGLVCWLERPDNESRGGNEEMTLCAIPKDIDKKLNKDLWCKGLPIILTSGTLSAGGDFTHIKRTLGLEHVKNRLTETSNPSPFNHQDNALLYISESVPFPDSRNRDYIDSLTNEIERLINAAHGHTAVLFTSYEVMDMVHEGLVSKDLPFPLFRLDRKNVNAIQSFKDSGNGVLLASGPMWEGIDIPGDALSMLIIVKLPFAVPDPISEYEQSLYPNIQEYKRHVIVPEMLLKLKQGFGRLIRLESDTGVVAILDSRVRMGGTYRGAVLGALPPCRVTDSITAVKRFIKAVKNKAYFQNGNVAKQDCIEKNWRPEI